MNKAELLAKIIDRITDPFTESLEDYANAEPMTLEEAKRDLEDYRRDDEAIDDPDFALPEETTPELLMEAYNGLIEKSKAELKDPALYQEQLERATEIVFEMTDGDPLAELTLDDARELISAALTNGYQIPYILTPEFFLELYNDLKEGAEE